MKCPECGKECTGRFCDNCGRNLSGYAPQADAPQTNAPQYASPMSADYPSYENKKQKKPIYKRPVFIIIAAVVVLTLISSLAGGKDKKENDDNPVRSEQSIPTVLSGNEKTETAAPTQPEITTAEKTTAPEVTTEKPEELVDGMRPSFKKAMDEYLEFFKNYTEAMDALSADPDSLTVMTKFLEMAARLDVISDELDAIDESELNAIEEAYYLMVMEKCDYLLLKASLNLAFAE